MVTLLAVSVPSIPQLSTDAMILAGTGLVVAYSMIAGYGALVREAISIYVGIVLAGAFGETVYNYASNGPAANLPITQPTVQLALLVIPIILLQFGRRHVHGAHKHHMIITLLIAVLTAMLLISSVMAQLDSDTLSGITEASNLASWISHLRLVWLGAVPVAIGVSAIFKPKRHHQ